MSYTGVRTGTAKRGGKVFNIQRPAREPGDRVTSKAQYLTRLEQDYAVKAAEKKIKDEAKAAKKREEWLAKYNHIDQGHRLIEGYLDEAAGGQDPQISEAVVPAEIRERQQEQHRIDALVFQEVENKKYEEKLRRDEEKKKKELEKYAHISCGYKLGNDPQISEAVVPPEIRERQQEQHQIDALKFQEIEKKVLNILEKKKHEEKLRRDEEKKKKELKKYAHISYGYKLGSDPEMQEALLETESRQRQLEQIRRDALIFQEQQKTNAERLSKENEAKKKKLESGENVSSVYKLHNGETIGNVAGKLPTRPSSESHLVQGQNTMPATHFHNSSNTAVREVAVSKTVATKSSGNEGPVPKEQKLERSSEDVQAKVEDVSAILTQFLEKQDVLKKISVGNPDEIKQALLVQLQDFLEQQPKKPTDNQINNSREQAATNGSSSASYKSECQTERRLSTSVVKPATATKGGVLVLRPTQEAAQKVLSDHLALQDFDKHGVSPLYTPRVVEVASKFEPEIPEIVTQTKSAEDLAKYTGAIPKQKPNRNAYQAPDTTFENNSEKTDADYKQEMRAARLRMQQKYNDTLLKQQNSQAVNVKEP